MMLIDRLSSGWKAWPILFLLTFLAAAPGVFNLPALDRDESRFAQASKQMLETGDYIRIRNQDELRNKKPAGIHWLQAASTAIFTGADAKEIWTYRVPSWLGAAFATLAVFWCGIPLLGRRAGFIGAALFGTGILLTTEAHIAKTDAVLVFLSTLAIGALARLYINNDHSRQTALLFWLALGCGVLIKGPVAPMIAAFAGVGAWVWSRLSTREGGRWWRVLMWWPGPFLFLLLVLPWFIWIQKATGGAFLQGAVGQDLGDKVSGASEGHGGIAFYHLANVPLLFFPATLLLIPGLAAMLNVLRSAETDARGRLAAMALIACALAVVSLLLGYVFPGKISQTLLIAYPALLIAVFGVLSANDNWFARFAPEDAPVKRVQAIRFLAAWGLLTWIFWEMLPTRLGHYVLPAYPAFALLAGYGAVRLIEGMRMPVSYWLSLVLFGLGAIVLLGVGLPDATTYFMDQVADDFRTVSANTVLESWRDYRSYPTGLWWIAFALVGFTLIEFARRRIGAAYLLGVFAALAIGWHLRLYMLPSQIWVQPTEVARMALDDVCGVPGDYVCMDGRLPPKMIQAIGYAEPSYVMEFGTQNLRPPATKVELPRAERDYPSVFLVNLENRKGGADPVADIAKLEGQAKQMHRCLTISEPYYALNYSNGDPVHFVALRFDAEPCEA